MPCLNFHDFFTLTVRSKAPELYHPSVKFEDVGGNDGTLKVCENFICGVQNALNKMSDEK